MNKLTILATAIALALFVSACTSTGTQAPEITYDGLHRVPDTRADLVYLKPGVDFSVYRKFGVTDCEVEFRKNWLRDQNSSRVSLSNRVTEKDVQDIKMALGAACEEQFREALAADPAYPVVEEFDMGEKVLVLRPAIIDLDISAPDVGSTGRSRTYTTSAGSMTLHLELVDGSSGEVLGRAIDKQREPESTYLTWTNSVTNKAEASRILRRWAGQLRKAVDQVHGAR